jgi:hypothetical protein
MVLMDMLLRVLDLLFLPGKSNNRTVSVVEVLEAVLH